MNRIRQYASYTVIGLLVIAVYALCVTKSSHVGFPSTIAAEQTKANSNVISVGSMEELENYIKNNKRVIIDIYASWCGPCNKFAPLYEKFAAKYPEICCIKVDGDKVPAVRNKYKVNGYPTFVLIKNGTKIKQFSGAPQNLERFEERVNALIS